MGLISNGSTIFDAGAMSAGFGGAMTFIKKLTASSSGTLSFVNGAGNDEALSGFLHLYDPASTTFVKHFRGQSNAYMINQDHTNHSLFAGYGNTTSAVDAVQFKMSSGNIDSGTIKMYGIK